MSTTTMYLPREHAKTSTPSTPQPNQPIRLGTYADGQRAGGVTVTFSPTVGSWATSSEGNPGAQSRLRRGWLRT
jgi:hypothetical protein